MSAPDKLRGSGDGEPPSELTKFKKLWRESLSESAREFWRELFLSDTTQAEIRKQIVAKLKVNLTYDKQLNQFRKWVAEQDKRNDEADRMKDDERRLTEEHGSDWTLDKIREEVLKRSYARTLATGEFGLGLATAKVDLRQQAQKFNETKFKEGLRKKLQAGLDAVAEAFKGNPDAMKLYKQARALIEREMK